MNPERINIKDLTIEEPESQDGLPFDPERDITAENWKLLENNLEKCRENKDWGNFACYGMEMKILNPSFDLKVDDTTWQEIHDYYKKHRDIYFSSYHLVMAMKVLNPSFSIDHNDLWWKAVKSDLQFQKNDKHGFDNFCFRAMAVKILDPSFDVEVNQKDWEKMEKRVKEIEEIGGESRIDVAAAMKILDSNTELNISEKAWGQMQQTLKKFLEREVVSPSYTGGFSRIAMELKLIAAQKVRVTDKGLEITMPQKLGEHEDYQLPEKRNF